VGDDADMRAFSPRAMRSIFSLESNDAFILLLTLDDPNSATMYRVALNNVDIVSRGNTYTACYFEITLPADNEDAPQGCQLIMDNVDLGLITVLRSIVAPIRVTLEIVVAATPDVVEMTLTDLIMRNVTWDVSTVQGTLISDDPLNQKVPGDIYEPRTFAGIF
jgi:hypothetical protein